MLLYNQNKDKLEVYDLLRDHNEIKEFRKRELELFLDNGNELLYRLKTSSSSYTAMAFESLRNNDTNPLEVFKYSIGYREWATLEKESLFNECIAKQFIEGALKDKEVSIITKIANNKIYPVFYFMDLEKCICSKRKCYLNCLMNLPESLYLLQLFEQGKYAKLANNIDQMQNIVGMYNATLIGEHNIAFLKELESQRLINNLDNILKNSECSKEVLKRVRTTK